MPNIRDSVRFSSVSWLCHRSLFRKGLCVFLRTDPAAAGSSHSSSNYHLLSTDTPDLKRGTFLPDLLKSPINLQVGLVVTLCPQGN